MPSFFIFQGFLKISCLLMVLFAFLYGSRFAFLKVYSGISWKFRWERELIYSPTIFSCTWIVYLQGSPKAVLELPNTVGNAWYRDLELTFFSYLTFSSCHVPLQSKDHIIFISISISLQEASYMVELFSWTKSYLMKSKLTQHIKLEINDCSTKEIF